MPNEEADLLLSMNASAIEQRHPDMTPEKTRQLLDETREQGYSFIPG